MDCADATGPKMCNGHSLLRYSGNSYLLFAGAKTTSNGSGRYIHFLYKIETTNMQIEEKVEFDSGTNNHYISKMAVFLDYVWMATGSQSNMAHFIYRYQLGTGVKPILFNIASSSYTTETISMYAVSADQMYELMKDSADRLRINHYTFDQSTTTYSYKTSVI